MIKRRRAFMLPATAVFCWTLLAISPAAPAQDLGPGRTPTADALLNAERGVAQEWEFHRRATSPNYRPTYNSMFNVNFSYSAYCPIRPHFLSRCPTCGNYSAVTAPKQ